ncbi:hypothetical protein MLD38_009842 [Melastoma candidum]|uniref:Uncharacterized protein n=1 Tax=Melastoma candidum TaxID=119954 RepID=A0ACB9RYV7_9MYRT|nr:hypothetical protein MLD38_009842 [Melastoma candidum]
MTRAPPPSDPGEGSWNVAWDVTPARWLHLPDSSWLLFGVCCPVQPIAIDDGYFDRPVEEVDDDKAPDPEAEKPADYRVSGVVADARCFFRAIAHSACLWKGEQAPDDNRQRELTDELRAQVVEELVKRRKQTEWFIEGDFDGYIKRIQELGWQTRITDGFSCPRDVDVCTHGRK